MSDLDAADRADWADRAGPRRADRAPAGGVADRGEFTGLPQSVLLFDAEGRAIAATADEAERLLSEIAALADLAARFRRVDGAPVELGGRSRQVAVSAEAGAGRVLLVSEPLVGADGMDGAFGFHGSAVSILPFATEDDPTTLLRALGSVLAHELRTPMTTIYAGSELVLGPGVSDATRLEAARSIRREAERLHRAIEDLVVLVRGSIDPGPSAEPVLVQRILAETISRQRALGGPAIRLRMEVGLPPVLGNAPDLEHLLRNVLDVALANCPAEGRVRVEARTADAPGDAAEIRTCDDGPGLNEAEAAAAFDLFARSRRMGGDASGANLRLVVARRLATRMAGTIRAAARPAGGEVVVRLPLA